MKFRELREYLFGKYPKSASYEGDNDGVEVCVDAEKEHSRILLALDYTMDTLEYAADNGFDCIITHHPMLFSPLKKLDPAVSGISAERALFAAAHKINCISLHTRLDCADGGVNDSLLQALGLDGQPGERFGPPNAAGAGKITELPYAVELGDFLCGIRAALNDYNEDNFKGSDIKVRISYVKGKMNVKKAAVVGGGGFDYIPEAIKAGADTFITGEGSYHKIIDAFDAHNPNIILLGHFETEITVLPPLAKQLAAVFSVPAVIFTDSKLKSF